MSLGAERMPKALSPYQHPQPHPPRPALPGAPGRRPRPPAPTADGYKPSFQGDENALKSSVAMTAGICEYLTIHGSAQFRWVDYTLC